MSTTVPTPLLCIDPSSTCVGWALLGPGGSYIASDAQLIPGIERDERVINAGHFVQHLMNTYSPAAIVLERPDYIAEKVNAVNIIQFHFAVGAMMFALHPFGRPVFWVNAGTIKKRGPKEGRMRRFQQLVGRAPLRHDESDAYCMGLEFLLQSPVLSLARDEAELMPSL